MTDTLSREETRLLRLHSQRLDSNTRATTVLDAVRSVCGIQAQDKGAAALSIRTRSQNLTATDIEHALYEDRSVVRTWCIRGTLHLVATADLPWLLSLFGPLNISRGTERRELAKAGLDDEACDHAMEVIRDALTADGPLTRDEIADRLQRGGIDVDPESQGPNFLIRRATLLGILCEVAPKDGANAYDLLEEWIPEPLEEPPDRKDALAELARRYLAAFGPASIEDFATWCRLYKRDVRKAWDLIAAERIEVRIDGEPASMLARNFTDDESVVDPKQAGTVRLLPYYDTYLLGYETHDRGVPAEYESRVWPGAALIRPVVTVDGRTIATWKLDRSRKTARVLVEPFGALDPEVELGIEAEVDDIGRFLDTEIEYRLDT